MAAAQAALTSDEWRELSEMSLFTILKSTTVADVIAFAKWEAS